MLRNTIFESLLSRSEGVEADRSGMHFILGAVNNIVNTQFESGSVRQAMRSCAASLLERQARLCRRVENAQLCKLNTMQPSTLRTIWWQLIAAFVSSANARLHEPAARISANCFINLAGCLSLRIPSAILWHDTSTVTRQYRDYRNLDLVVAWSLTR
jgi:hypothetical protein